MDKLAQLKQKAKELMEEIERLENAPKEESNKKWKRFQPSFGETFLYTTASGIYKEKWAEDPVDLSKFKDFNVFHPDDEEFAQSIANKQLAMRELEFLARELNEGWSPDWINAEESIWSMTWSYKQNKMNVLQSWFMSGGMPIFKSKELAQEAWGRLSENGKDFIKGLL